MPIRILVTQHLHTKLMVSIQGKSVGGRKRLFDDFSVPIAKLQSPDNTSNLSELIKAIVTDQANEFSKRQTENQLLRVLTSDEIQDGLHAGKISSGSTDVPKQPVDITQAVASAIDAFSDGLYYVFIDSTQITTLEEKFRLEENSRIMFVRLTLIAGG